MGILREGENRTQQGDGVGEGQVVGIFGRQAVAALVSQRRHRINHADVWAVVVPPRRFDRLDGSRAAEAIRSNLAGTSSATFVGI